MLKVLDHEFDIDMMDLDVGDRVWAKVTETEKKLQDIQVLADGSAGVMAQQTEIFNMFTEDFESILGEGATQKILNGKRHFSIALQAWYDMYTGIVEQYAGTIADTVRMQKDAAKKFSAARIAKR